MHRQGGLARTRPVGATAVLARRGPSQLNVPFSAADLVAGHVDHQPVAAQDRGRAGADAAAEGEDPGDQFGEGERFAEVVVGAEGQPVNAVVDRGGGGEHQHPGRASLVYQDLADRIAVQQG